MKKCFVLLAALLIGALGSRVDAASIHSVTVTTPADSGALRGIDSSFVVTTRVIDFTPVDSLEVVMYLAVNDSTVVGDLAAGTDFGSLDQASVVLIGQNKNIRAGRYLRDGQTTAIVSTDGLIAVQQKKARGAANKANIVGNGDSVVVSTSGDTVTYKWYGKLTANSGTMSLVRAAALVVDDNTSGSPASPTWPTHFSQSEDTTDVTLSAANRLFTVDGDRPLNPGEFISRGTGGTVIPTVSGFSRGNTTILGIGDSIKVDVKLGGQANAVLIGDSLSVVSDYFGKAFKLSKTARSADTLQHRLVLAEGMFGNLLEAGLMSDATNIDTLQVFIVDKAGNRSGTTADGVATGVTAAASFFVDTKLPALDAQVTAGDTILPVAGDTIADGSLHDDFTRGSFTVNYPDDGDGPRTDKVLSWNLPEALDSLIIGFDGSTADATIALASGRDFADVELGNGPLGVGAVGTATGFIRKLDFTSLGNKGTNDTLQVAKGSDGSSVQIFSPVGSGHQKVRVTRNSDSLRTGLHTISFQAVDLALNVGPALSRANVYIDVDDIILSRLFPTDASGLDTIEETTSQVVFRLSEPADSVVIAYLGIAGPDDTKARTRRLSGSSLTNTSTEQTLPVDSLRSGTRYVLSVLARDLAGNFTRSSADTFVYDTAFTVPVIAKFAITADTAKTGYGSPILAGDTLTFTVVAQTSKSTDAVTYKGSAILKVTGSGGKGGGVAVVSGTGATDLGNGRITLNADDWVTGRRTVIIKDTTSVDTLSVSIVDSTNSASIYSGKLDSVISINPNKYDHIWVSAPDTVNEGEAFWVALKLVDVYGNTRVKDNRYVNVTANKLGVDAPFEAGGIYVEKGVGGFWATSESFTGNDLVFRVRDVIAKTTTLPGSVPTDVGDNFIHGKSDSILVLAAGDSGGELAAPGEPVAQDYMGADGAGDQGGFILLNFAPSDDHETLTAYRIWREIVVDYDLDDTGALVELAEPTSKYIPWAKVDAVPGTEGAMHVVVATLDGVATNWAISAERGRETTAKLINGVTASPMERMAQKLMKKQMVKAPVFATLTPEALAFIQKGIAPRMKDTLPLVVQSAKVYTKQPVRAIDNIAPEAITALRALDTPSDAGGSITVNWVKSESDGTITRMIPGAVGPVSSDVVAGVKGYNVYRKSGRGDYTLVGKTGSGETTFADATVFNGERYTYQVSAYDEDNEARASMERTAMAIRNRVFDRAGAVVLGLFGMDNKVGFDDFFVLADRFGLTAGDEGFDPAFDLRPDNRIDFDDFFVFADNFGKAIEGAAKVLPVLAGLNTSARLDLNAGSTLPRIGEELTVAVDMADFVEVKGYGFSVNYDPSVLEFVRVASENTLLGESKLAQPQVADKADGSVAIVAYGQTATEGNLGVSLVFRTKAEIENSWIELTEAQLQDGSYGLNQVASLGQVQVQTRPEVYHLADNYPNPFNPETTLKYQLPEAADVKLEVYNVVGQVVRTLVANHQDAGRYVVQWDAANDNGQPLSSGIYFYHIQAGDFQKTKKMLLLK
ncbi:MAG: T9SS type A sorting domain-containing protein [Candidatus Latescibacteria bacterium]|nr:T9SS type A sorting domain-containing protein [Candidatus Latescibacterota bacterium]